jgi:hypothetical protein
LPVAQRQQSVIGKWDAQRGLLDIHCTGFDPAFAEPNESRGQVCSDYRIDPASYEVEVHITLGSITVEKA